MTSGSVETIKFGEAKMLGTNTAITNKCQIPGFDTTNDVNKAIAKCREMPDCTHLNFYPGKEISQNNVVYRNCKGIMPETQTLAGWTAYSVKPNMLT